MSHNLSRRSALKLLLGSAAAFACAPHFALADTASDLAAAQAEADKVQKQLEDLGNQMNDVASQVNATMDKIEETTKKISKTESDIEDTEEELKENQEQLKKRVAASYKNGTNGIISLLLSATSFDELASNIYYLDKISESDKAVIDKVKTTKAQLTKQKQDLEDQKSDLEEQQKQKQAQYNDMKAKQDEVQKTLSGLNQQVAQLIAQRDAELEAQARQRELQKQAQEAAEKAAAAAAAQQKSSGSSSGGSSSGGSSSGGSSSAGSSSAASGKGAAIVSACSRVPSPGAGLCAMWVSRVYSAAGAGYPGGNANDMYWNYCTSSNQADLQPGMIVAVPSHPHTVAGSIYGHVGIYIGNGMVMQNIGSINTQSLSAWIAYYGATYTPRWGWA